MENVRILEMPAGKMVSSKAGMFGDGKLEAFDAWFSTQARTMYAKDYLWFSDEAQGFVWFYTYSDDLVVPQDFDIVDFAGGLYAVATDIDGQDNAEAFNTMRAFIGEKGCFEEDKSRPYMGNVINPPSVGAALGYNQMDYFMPIKIKDKA